MWCVDIVTLQVSGLVAVWKITQILDGKVWKEAFDAGIAIKGKHLRINYLFNI